jgi:Tfp pilus assembly protein PilF
MGDWAAGLILSIGTASPAESAKLTDQALSSKINLLDGRLTIDMPTGTEVDSEHSSIKRDEASEVLHKETRASVKLDKQQLDLSVRELYATSGNNFDGNARKVFEPNLEAGKSKLSLGVKTIKSGLKMCQLKTEEAAKSNTQNQIVETAIVENTDGTVQFISIRANSDAAKSWKAVSTLADNILSSIAPGTKTLPTKSRKIEIDTFYGLVSLVPEGTATNSDVGADFHVFTFNKIHELGTPAAYLSIYIGQHPAYRPKDLSAGRPGTILGQPIKWQEEHANSLHLAQTLVPLQGTPTVLHIFCVAGSDQDISELIKIAEGLSTNEKAPANLPPQKASLLYICDKFQEAAAVCDAALKSDPVNRDLLRVRADSHMKLKEYQAASLDYSALIKLDKEVSGNIINRAKCFYELGKYQSTVEDCNQAIDANLAGNTALILRGQANTQLKNFKDAQRDFDKALQYDSKDSSCYIARAQLYRAEGAFKKAIEDCTKANSIWENDEALAERACNYEKIGLKNLALKDRARAAEINTGSTNHHWPW